MNDRQNTDDEDAIVVGPSVKGKKKDKHMSKSKSLSLANEEPKSVPSTSQSFQQLPNSSDHDDYFDLINTNLAEFVMKPAPQNISVKCRIERDNHGVDKTMSPKYFMRFEKDDGKKVKFFLIKKFEFND